MAPNDLDLLVNAGLYRDRNLGEPALASMIQEDVRRHPEDPHPGGHGTFSFDVANGACGVLTALQIADRFLRSARSSGRSWSPATPTPVTASPSTSRSPAPAAHFCAAGRPMIQVRFLQLGQLPRRR